MEQSMRTYEYYLYGDRNGYGQPTLSEETQGQIKMAIYETSTSVQQNINYTGASYIGLTHDANINDKYVIAFGDEKLKVLYVKPGRYKQVFLGAM
jgi:hypothetical protein